MIRIGIGTVGIGTVGIGIGIGIGIGKAIGTGEEARMTLITKTAARKTEAEYSPLDQVANVIAVIRAIVMVSDTSTPMKMPTPPLVE